MKTKESRNVKILINSAGGNASKNAKTYRVSLPAKWMHELGINQENRNVVLTFDGQQIVMEREKKKNEE